MALPNLKHFVLSNRCYGSTNELPLRFSEQADYAAMARAAGIERVYCFATVEQLGKALDEILGVAGHVFAVLDVEPLGRHLPSPPLDGPELKFRFGRYLERVTGRPIFDAPLFDISNGFDTKIAMVNSGNTDAHLNWSGFAPDGTLTASSPVAATVAAGTQYLKSASAVGFDTSKIGRAHV